MYEMVNVENEKEDEERIALVGNTNSWYHTSS